MRAVKIINYRTWKEFKADYVSTLYSKKRHFIRDMYLFRGQSMADYQLITSFDRTYQRIDSASRNKIANDLWAEFKKEMLMSMDNLNEIEWIALAQHSGVPTRLLDWSESPYVAAFFAFSGVASINYNLEDSCVSIWVLNRHRSDIWNVESGVQIVDVSPISNARLRNQEGHFTLSKTPFASLEEYVDYFCKSETLHDSEKFPLLQMNIPASEATVALSDLDAMRIRYSTLFPDTHGAAQTAKMRVAMRSLMSS